MDNNYNNDQSSGYGDDPAQGQGNGGFTAQNDTQDNTYGQNYSGGYDAQNNYISQITATAHRITPMDSQQAQITALRTIPTDSRALHTVLRTIPTDSRIIRSTDLRISTRTEIPTALRICRIPISSSLLWRAASDSR